MAPPEVVRVGRDDASGFASMIADLLEQNIEDFPLRARVAGLVRGAVVLTASDQDLSVTLRFGPGRVLVGDGAEVGAPTLAGTWLAMAQVCSGRISPLVAARARTLRITPGSNPIALAGAAFAMSVPPSTYETEAERHARRRRARRATVALAVGIVLALLALGRRSPEKK